MAEPITTETLPDGARKLSGGRCSFTLRRMGAGVLHVSIVGRDKGQFGPAVFEEIRCCLAGPASLEMFVDATDAEGPTSEVSDAWTRFFASESTQLKRVSILAPSKFVHLTVSVAKLFSRTGELIQVYSDRQVFQSALDRATAKP